MDPTGWVIDAIAGETKDILLAGHFPHLPRLLTRLITGEADAAAGQFPLNGMVALDTSGERWVECWRLKP
jgi:phosphohistidine phosphatase SixA